ncbi:MAG: hypothetical protein ISQ44_02140 [Cryomorphaceae bacterium]|nr:hypothetical protein [Cryomorphaceae bacterium]
MKPIKTTQTLFAITAGALLAASCGKNKPTPAEPFEAVYAAFGTSVPLEPPFSYESQAPAYFQKDNRGGVAIDDKKATLGRVLFYDKALSESNHCLWLLSSASLRVLRYCAAQCGFEWWSYRPTQYAPSK